MTNKTGEKDKIVGVCIPTWNPNDPRFIVKESNDGIAEERGFKNGECVFNQRLGFAYSVNEIVEVLNEVVDTSTELLKEFQEWFNNRGYACDCMGQDITIGDDDINDFIQLKIDRLNKRKELQYD